MLHLLVALSSIHHLHVVIGTIMIITGVIGVSVFSFILVRVRRDMADMRNARAEYRTSVSESC
jgi:hypothetical protein